VKCTADIDFRTSVYMMDISLALLKRNTKIWKKVWCAKKMEQKAEYEEQMTTLDGAKHCFVAGSRIVLGKLDGCRKSRSEARRVRE
jgi:hypothetical protein